MIKEIKSKLMTEEQELTQELVQQLRTLYEVEIVTDKNKQLKGWDIIINNRGHCFPVDIKFHHYESDIFTWETKDSTLLKDISVPYILWVTLYNGKGYLIPTNRIRVRGPKLIDFNVPEFITQTGGKFNPISLSLLIEPEDKVFDFTFNNPRIEKNNRNWDSIEKQINKKFIFGQPETVKKKDFIPTPKVVTDYLKTFLSDKVVYDPCCGDGSLLLGKINIGRDLSTDFSIEPAADCFSKPSVKTLEAYNNNSDNFALVVNPPFSYLGFIDKIIDYKKTWFKKAELWIIGSYTMFINAKHKKWINCFGSYYKDDWNGKNVDFGIIVAKFAEVLTQTTMNTTKGIRKVDFNPDIKNSTYSKVIEGSAWDHWRHNEPYVYYVNNRCAPQTTSRGRGTKVSLKNQPNAKGITAKFAEEAYDLFQKRQLKTENYFIVL